MGSNYLNFVAMTQHFNIFQNTVINPFEHVTHIRVASGAVLESAIKGLLNKSEGAATARVGDEWVMCYTIDCLNFVTLITWFAPYRGKFTFQTKYGEKSVHFRIDEPISYFGKCIVCW